MRIERQLTTTPKTLPDANQLVFGKHFSDHWLLAKYSEGQGWYESTIRPLEPIPVHPGASVFHYGQALFEGMKAFRQPDKSISLFRPEFNYERMCAGAERLCLVPPTKELFIDGINELVNVEERWVFDNENTSLYLRPTLVGTEAFLGVRPSREVLFFVLASPVGSYYSEGVKPLKIWVEEKYLRAAPGGLGATKAGANYASSLKAAVEAKKKNYSQVLWLDTEREGIEEVGTMNIFFVFKNEIVTPALNGSILAGNIRDSAIQLLKHEGHTVNERRITMTEVIEKLMAGELLEVFGTGTAAVISPVGTLHAREKDWIINKHEEGPIASGLRKTLRGIQRGTSPDIFNWMVSCSQ